MLIALSFFFNDTATTEIYTLSLHDALPISSNASRTCGGVGTNGSNPPRPTRVTPSRAPWSPLGFKNFNGLHGARLGVTRRSAEHTSELQSQSNLVCRLLLEKKKPTIHATSVRDSPATPVPICVLSIAMPASPFRPPADPALKPHEPTHNTAARINRSPSFRA